CICALSSSADAQAVAFAPTVSAFPNGVTLNVTPVVSADRRYVRMTVKPLFTGLLGFDTIAVPAGGSGGGVGGGGGGRRGRPRGARARRRPGRGRGWWRWRARRRVPQRLRAGGGIRGRHGRRCHQRPGLCALWPGPFRTSVLLA